MKGRVNDKAHLELILKSIGNVFEFTAKYVSYEQFENDKLCLLNKQIFRKKNQSMLQTFNGTDIPLIPFADTLS